MNCSSCGHQNRPGVRFCEQCGIQMPQAAAENTGRFCSGCGQAINPANKFCENCGTAIGDSRLKPRLSMLPFMWLRLLTEKGFADASGRLSGFLLACYLSAV